MQIGDGIHLEPFHALAMRGNHVLLALLPGYQPIRLHGNKTKEIGKNKPIIYKGYNTEMLFETALIFRPQRLGFPRYAIFPIRRLSSMMRENKSMIKWTGYNKKEEGKTYEGRRAK